jgi:hypothetical protein
MWLVQLKLLGCTLKRMFLQLYCPLRRQRERLSPDRWLLLAVVPPVVALLVALVVCLLARGPAAQFVVGGSVAVVIAAAVYALLSIQASLFGPSFSDAEQALTAARDRQAALGAEIAYARRHFAGGGVATRPLAVFEGYYGRSLCFGPDSGTLALLKSVNERQFGDPSENSWISDQIVELWDLATGKCRSVLDVGSNLRGGQQVCFSPDGTLLAVARRDDTVQLWDAQLGHCVSTLRQPRAGDAHFPTTIAFAPNGTIMASAFDHSYDNRDFSYCTIDLWDLTNGRCIASVPPVDASCVDVSLLMLGFLLVFDPTSRILAVSSQVSVEAWVQLLDSCTGKRIGNYKVGDRESLSKMWFDERGRLGALTGPFVLANLGWCFKLWDVSKCGHLELVATHPLTMPGAVRGVPVYTSDFRLMAIPVADAYAEVCDSSTGGSIVRVAGIPMAFSPDNQMLVTSLDKTFFGKEASGYGLWAIPPQGEVV